VKAVKWNENWKVWKDADSFALVWNVPEDAEVVTLPHDAMIEDEAYADSPNGGNAGYRDGAIYNYVKTLHPEVNQAGERILLHFDGVYMNTFVYVNEQLAGKNPYGYTGFNVDISDYLKYGEDNEIRVQVRNGAMTNSRWYSGSGISRDVYLVTGGSAYIDYESVRIKTVAANFDYATLELSAVVSNTAAKVASLRLETVIRDADGNECVTEKSSLVLGGTAGGRSGANSVITGGLEGVGTSRRITQRVAVDSPSLWSAETPVLYTAELRLVDSEGNVVDEECTEFGIRTLALDAKRGLQVNGETVKLRGACVHNDSGVLGAATYEDAEMRRAELLKAAGFNSIRMSHHPCAPALLRACDRVGLYVMDELTDMWNRLKSNYDYGLYFAEWWERDVESMVRQDYNHPSVVMYSIGNEIPEIGTCQGAAQGAAIAAKCHELDDTRYTTAGINGVFAAGDKVGEIVGDIMAAAAAAGEPINGGGTGNVNDFMTTVMNTHMDDIVTHRHISDRLALACASLDIAGYNYMTARYALDAKENPNRVMVGSETCPPAIARNWGEVEKYPQVIGDFTWTGWDYIGEAGVGVPAYKFGDGGFGAQFPCQLAYSGDIDITGFRRPASYYREIVFGLRKNPYITVQDPNHYGENIIKTPWVISDSVTSWNWTGCEGKPAVVEVYSAGAEVELLQARAGGEAVSLGRQPAGAEAGFMARFETTYEPGTLTAVSYDEDGKEIGRDVLASAGESKISLTAGEKGTCEGLIYIAIEKKDSNGVILCDADEEITVKVEGTELIGFGTGNPKPTYNYTGDKAVLWNGRALAVVKAGAGKGTLTVTSAAGETETIAF